MNLYLPDQLIAVHTAFARDAIPHAFGGAIAFAYYGQPRATRDIDVNIFLSADHHRRVLDSLASLFPIPNRDTAEEQLRHTAQTRLRWGAIPIDLFLADLPFHEAMATRARTVDFVGVPIPILSAEDLIICKAVYDRPKVWVDIASIFTIQQRLDAGYLRRWLAEFFEPDDDRLRRVESFLRESRQGSGPEQS
jgi:hypothetical protein